MICFIGSPACGKGSQSSILKKKYGCFIFSFGDYLRKEISKKTDFGKMIAKRIANGEILSIKELFSNLDCNIFKNDQIILDGFPRTLEQAEFFFDFCKEHKLKLDYVIEFQAKDEVLIERMNNRVMCLDCLETYSKKDLVCKCGSNITKIREDDNIEVFTKRLNDYKFHRSQITKFYQDKPFYRVVDANQSFNKVTNSLKEIISDWLR